MSVRQSQCILKLLHYLILCMFISIHQSSSYSTDGSSFLLNTKLCTISLKFLISIPPAHPNTVLVKTLRTSFLDYAAGLLIWSSALAAQMTSNRSVFHYALTGIYLKRRSDRESAILNVHCRPVSNRI